MLRVLQAGVLGTALLFLVLGLLAGAVVTIAASAFAAVVSIVNLLSMQFKLSRLEVAASRRPDYARIASVERDCEGRTFHHADVPCRCDECAKPSGASGVVKIAPRQPSNGSRRIGESAGDGADGYALVITNVALEAQR
jgi:hypothetical protein